MYGMDDAKQNEWDALDLENVSDKNLDQFAVLYVDDEPKALKYFERYFKGLSEKDRNEIRDKGPFPLIVTCQNCSSVYSFEESHIKKILS